MKIYFMLIVSLGLSVSIIAGSLIFFLWIAHKYDSDSFEYKVARIATLWIDCLISLAASYFCVNSIPQEIQEHPMATTAFLLVGVSIITAASYNHRRYLPIVCACCAFPFLMYGIWFDPTDYYASTLGFMAGWSIVSIIYGCVVCVGISDRKKKDPPQPEAEVCQDDAEATSSRPSAVEVLSDVIERGIRDLGID